MKRVRIALLVAATIATAGASAGTAAAAISPNPYSTSSGTGTYQVTNLFGIGTCSLTTGAALAGLSTGAAGSLTSLTAGGCTGWLTGMSQLFTDVTVNRGSVSVTTAMLFTSIVNRCLYQGTLTGTATSPASSVTVSGTLSLVRILGSGASCEAQQISRLTLDFPGASITW